MQGDLRQEVSSMKDRIMRKENIEEFCHHLQEEEKSPVTIEKYRRDVFRFFCFVCEGGKNTEKADEEMEADGGAPAGNTILLDHSLILITKELTIAYKHHLQDQSYAVRSINSMLAALNSFLGYMGWTECRVKTLCCQREIYSSEEKELTKEEYKRLLESAKGSPRLYLLLQTICATGIRVSELEYFTVEGVRKGTVTVRCKNKTRRILIPSDLRNRLLTYAAKHQIGTGPIFITRGGKKLDRSNIWAQMKHLCQTARVRAGKVFPHNLRKLFARTFYGKEKDIAKLADILGHGSIETTRIYIMSSGDEHRRRIEGLGLVI